MSEKQQFLDAWGRECPTTLKLLKAYPAAKADLKPHERSRSAKELAWTFVFEGVGGAQVLDGELKLPPRNMLPMPDTWVGMVRECERALRGLRDKDRKASDADLTKTVKFLTGPNQMADVLRL